MERDLHVPRELTNVNAWFRRQNKLADRACCRSLLPVRSGSSPAGVALGGAFMSVGSQAPTVLNNRTVQQQHWRGAPRAHVADYCAATWLTADRRVRDFRKNGGTAFSCR